MTEEEKEDFEDDPNAPIQINRAMTEEVNEYIHYVEKYQEENNISEVCDYVQYIAEELDKDKSLEITDELSVKAEKFINRQHKKEKYQNSRFESP